MYFRVRIRVGVKVVSRVRIGLGIKKGSSVRTFSGIKIGGRKPIELFNTKRAP